MNTNLQALVVDDDPVVMALVEAALAGTCRVAAAAGGEAALKRFTEHGADLLVLDVSMPGLDGYEICRRLRNTTAGAEVPVIFLSGYAGIDERLQGYAAGGDDYIVKPFEAAELRAKVERSLAARARQVQMAGQLDEMTHTALSTVDMMGDAGVVLDLQRELAGCGSYEAVAEALLEAMARFDLEGCVRVRGSAAAFTRNSRGAATALEGSILDARRALSALAGSRQLVQITRTALQDISARDRAQREQIRHVFERLNTAVEDSFISLGLTRSQEDQLAEVIRAHGQEVAAVLDSAREVQTRLSGVIGQLEAAQ